MAYFQEIFANPADFDTLVILKMGNQRAYAHIFRGPILVIAALASLLLPYLSTCSSTFLIKTAVALVGLLWFCFDLFRFFKKQVRRSIRSLLENLVLDDVLRALCDPETGFIAGVVGTFVGASSMYTLGMNAEQRTKLVQSSLLTSEEETRSILLKPGGCKSLLPQSMRSWLEEEDTKLLKAEIVEDEEYSDTSMSECTVENEEDASLLLDESAVQSSRIDFSSEPETQTPMTQNDQSDRISAGEMENETRFEAPTTPMVDPVTTMFSIIRELLFERIKPRVTSIPESMLENVGMTAALALALQLGIRLRSKRTLLSSFSAMALSGIATGSFSTILAKHAVLGNIYNRETLQKVMEAVAIRLWEKIKNTAMTKVQWKGILAMVVLSLAGRKRN